MPKDLVDALALVCALAGDVAVGVAILLSFDCLLRISEVAGLRVGDIVDHRHQADIVGRGVAVYLRSMKTGVRQAVRIEDPALATLVVAWQAAVARHKPSVSLFPGVAKLRAASAARSTLSRTRNGQPVDCASSYTAFGIAARPALTSAVARLFFFPICWCAGVGGSNPRAASKSHPVRTPAAVGDVIAAACHSEGPGVARGLCGGIGRAGGCWSSPS